VQRHHACSEHLCLFVKKLKPRIMILEGMMLCFGLVRAYCSDRGDCGMHEPPMAQSPGWWHVTITVHEMNRRRKHGLRKCPLPNVSERS
jgi:hypothetical protein